ncbi:DUF1090 family protein [Variovorax sp. LT1P1]|uniref:DUF1090 family protein n=1 Tax=Variovorax sp. LT1P1 TaxID=3443730 RepID=UPI003F462FFA
MAFLLTLAAPALAQPQGQIDRSACKAEQSEIEQNMDLAQSKGQMLRRRQLAEALIAVKTRCGTLGPEQTRTANIERLEREARALRQELDHAEEQLRKLKQEAQ